MPYVVPPVSYSPSRAVMDVLDGANCPSPSVGIKRDRNLFRGLVRDAADGKSPETAIFVLGSMGMAPESMGVTILSQSVVDVWVRANRNAVGEGEDLARFVWRRLHHNVPAAPYLELECLESEPRFADLDDTEHPRWVIQVRLTREE